MYRKDFHQIFPYLKGRCTYIHVLVFKKTHNGRLGCDCDSCMSTMLNVSSDMGLTNASLHALHACASLMHACWSQDPAHVWFITSVTEHGCSGSLSPNPHASIFTSLLLTNPLETERLRDKTDRSRDGREGGLEGGSEEEEKVLCCCQTDVCQNGRDEKDILLRASWQRSQQDHFFSHWRNNFLFCRRLQWNETGRARQLAIWYIPLIRKCGKCVKCAKKAE